MGYPMSKSVDARDKQLEYTYISHDDIVCGNAVRRDEQEGLRINLEEIANFSLGDLGERGQGAGGDRGVRHD